MKNPLDAVLDAFDNVCEKFWTEERWQQFEQLQEETAQLKDEAKSEWTKCKRVLNGTYDEIYDE